MIRKNGGIWFWQVGSLGGSLYLKRKRERFPLAMAVTFCAATGMLIGIGAAELALMLRWV